MKVTLNTNIASLKAQGTLGKVEKQLSTVFERLSTGLRINRPGDDPAGLAIADNLKLGTDLFLQANRNIQDGISMLSIMDSGLEQQAGLLQRMGELAEQSANGVFSFTQRAALNTEYRALVDEFGRIGESTEFNGQKLLNGDVSSVALQVGTSGESNARIALSVPESAENTGVVGLDVDLTNNGIVDAGDSGYFASFNLKEINELMSGIGHAAFTIEVTDSLGQDRIVHAMVVASVFDNLTGINPPFTATLNADRIDVSFGLFEEDGYTTLHAITQQAYDAPITENITFVDTGATADITLDFTEFDFQNLEFFKTVRKTAIDFTGVETAGRARDALDTVRNRLEDTNALRGEVGAVFSRLESALESSTTLADNYRVAESRIRDADIATETAELVRLQVLQQATAAVLGQANQQTAIALQILGE